MHDRPAAVRAAANTAASWVRARRAAWTDAEATLARIAAESQALEPEPDADTDTAEADPTPDARSWRGWSIGKTLGRWLPRGAAVVGILALGGTAYAFWMRPATPSTTVVKAAPTPVAAPTVTAPVAPAAPAHKTGKLSATSDPAGASVQVDGKPRGVTPLTISDLTPGAHVILFSGAAGSVHRSVTIVADQTAQIAEAIFDGWVAVVAPFDVTIAEGSRALALDDRGQLMLHPGRHDLHLQNRALGYEDVKSVDVLPGETTSLSVVPPKTTMTVTANVPASVWIDGVLASDAPASAAVGLGSHDIVVKTTDRGERKFTITATVKPVRLDVDFSKGL